MHGYNAYQLRQVSATVPATLPPSSSVTAGAAQPYSHVWACQRGMHVSPIRAPDIELPSAKAGSSLPFFSFEETNVTRYQSLVRDHICEFPSVIGELIGLVGQVLRAWGDVG